ncbi:type 2 isopentenyl-diphosphate Delta-isomerase [Leucobacter luti]|uniref:type 2 isopentenyl-diphosphate Delta-isomerase n=1 Tax=Leucobacter luti TaxID=340320 RepID=UPI003D05FFB6
MGSERAEFAPATAHGLRAERKNDHLRLAHGQATAREAGAARSDFDELQFIHHALGGIDSADVELSVEVAGARWPCPLFINGMTGGTDAARGVNRALAAAARETGVPMGCGSVSIALDDPRTAPSFTVIREENPEGIVFANLGADRPAADAVRAVELVGADALQIHLNAVQEIAMTEGSRELGGWRDSLQALIAASPVPVIVKEVGFGLSRRTIDELGALGVHTVDVSGRGGTDFLAIENERRGDDGFAMLAGFGQSTAECLLEAAGREDVTVLASGGIRNPLDAVKCLALGARGVGIAGAFLRVALDGGGPALIDRIEAWQGQLRALLALLGAPDPAALEERDLLVRGRLLEYCGLRGIDASALARRRPPAASLGTQEPGSESGEKT